MIEEKLIHKENDKPKRLEVRLKPEKHYESFKDVASFILCEIGFRTDNSKLILKKYNPEFTIFATFTGAFSLKLESNAYSDALDTSMMDTAEKINTFVTENLIPATIAMRMVNAKAVELIKAGVEIQTEVETNRIQSIEDVEKLVICIRDHSEKIGRLAFAHRPLRHRIGRWFFDQFLGLATIAGTAESIKIKVESNDNG